MSTNKFRNIVAANGNAVNKVECSSYWKSKNPKMKVILVGWGTTGRMLEVSKKMKIWENTENGRMITEEIATIIKEEIC